MLPENFQPRPEAIRALLRSDSRDLRTLLMKRMRRMSEFVEIGAPAVILHHEHRLVEEVREALKGKNMEPYLHS